MAASWWRGGAGEGGVGALHGDHKLRQLRVTDDLRERIRAWSSTIAGHDGYVVVTPEYNRSSSGVLKNAMDLLFAEWNGQQPSCCEPGV